MHMLLAVRGYENNLNQWEEFMKSQWFTWLRRPILKDSNGNYIKDESGNYVHGEPVITRVQGSLRPFRFYEYVFPRDGVIIEKGKAKIDEWRNVKEVLAMMDEHKNYINMRKEMVPIAWILRKITGAYKIPEFPDIVNKERDFITNKYTPHEGVAICTVGIKDDKFGDIIFNHPDGRSEGWDQEWL